MPGTIAKNHGVLAGWRRGARPRRSFLPGRRDGEWHSRARTGNKADLGSDVICVDGEGDRAARRGGLFPAEQTEGLCDDGERSRGTTDGGGLLGKRVGRVYPVGRLDYASEGLCC